MLLKKHYTCLLFSVVFGQVGIFAQEAPVEDTSAVEEIADEFDNSLLSGEFNATRIINGHSTKTLKKGNLDYRIEHRFGDVAGSPNDGFYTWFGLDNSTDIRMAFEYGITDNLTVGIGRSKGASSAFSSLVDGLVKYRILDEKNKKSPVSLSVVTSAFYTYQRSSPNVYDVNHFERKAHRFSYATVAIINRQISRRISASLLPTYIHRNYVAANDLNDLFALGGAVKVGITKQMGVVVEYYQTFHNNTVRQNNKNSLGVGVEFVTFGHTFTINLTNSAGLGEPQFVAATTSDWLKGQFRLGFTIGRTFSW